MTEVFLVNLKYPTDKIKKVEVKIIVRTLTWAQETNGKRHLLGASAFYTLPSAFRCKQSLLLQLKRSSYIRAFAYEGWKMAVEQLNEYHKTKQFEFIVAKS